MDDEAAEIELLEQNLNKTRQISQRMISILSGFDTRLLKLEKSIMPLYSSTKRLNRRVSNIDRTIQYIGEMSGGQEDIAAEEGIIIRGPQSTELRAYTEAIDRLNASFAFKESGEDSSRTAQLVESGARKLAQLYTTIVAEASSGSPPQIREFTEPSASLAPFAPNLIDELLPIVSFLRTLPLPSTHPSHPAASSIQNALMDAQRGYADMRGSWSRKCLEADSRRAAAEFSDGALGSDEGRIRQGVDFALWIERMLDVAENEHSLLTELAILPSQLQAAYCTFLTPLLSLVSSALNQLTTRVKRALQQHAFLALAAYARLSSPNVSQRWDDIISRRSGKSARDQAAISGKKADINTNTLKEGLHSLRAVCLRSFPELLADIKLAAIPKGGAVDVGTGVVEICETVVKYLQQVPAVQDAVASALLTLGDGNWKMGEGLQVSKGPKLGEGDESVVLEHYLYDIIMTTVNTLTTMSRSNRRPAVGAIFLLNNVSYLSSAILDPSPTPYSDVPVAALLAPPARTALQSQFRTAKAGYFDANFSPLVQVLGDGAVAGITASGKAGTKEKFTRFYELLEELFERHRGAKVLPDDDGGRDAIAEEAVKLIVPSLQRFIQKNREKEFSKNPQKYIKLSPEEVERQIRSLY
ncbi:hypothetical protein SCHPADRAFT_906774 [Schizopora paradoxa]|uniref:Exocyst complex protein EXO70 n=1 Tax=Schizopora paradoxa TaxID=27342 RepID=A0A0H2S0Q9_9AGAM|nr:hypothetical protein SCHPADRAFT_906774 [Schizopora paradoxa]